MTKFAVHSLATAPEGSRAQLEADAKAWGFVTQLHGTLAESPAALIGYDTLFGLVAASTLSPAEQQVAYLTVSVFNECDYCTMGHTYLARNAALPEDEIQALRAGAPLSDPRLNALSTFVRAVVAQRGFVGDAGVEAFLAAGFSRANVLDLVALIAAKTISNYTNHLTNTRKESFMSDPALVWTAPGKLTAAE